MKESEITRILSILQVAYPQRPMAPAAQRLYAEMLADLEGAETLHAVKALVLTRESEWYPTIAEIRRAVVAQREQLPPPDAAWAEVQRAISKWGRYRAPKWTHPAIDRAVDAIGWQAICDSTEPEILRAQFVKSFYTPIAAKWVEQRNVESLLGPAPAPSRQLGPTSAGDAVKRLRGGR